MKKKYIFVFLLILILFVIFFLSSLFMTKKNISNIEIILTPTPFPFEKKTTGVGSNTVPPVSYSSTESDKLVEKIKKRIPLSSQGAATKQKLLTQLGGVSGVLFTSSSVSIQYIKSPDLFQVEILSINIDSAKNESTSWFVAEGFSKEDVCNLPVSFFLNWDVANSLRNQNIVFNPLPEGC